MRWFFIVPIAFAAAFGFNQESLFDQLRSSEKEFNKDSNNSKKSIISKYNIDMEKNTSSSYLDSIIDSSSKNAMQYTVDSMKRFGVTDEFIDKFQKNPINKINPLISTHFFLLTSKTVPLSVQKNFMKGVFNLKKTHPEFRGMILFQGWPENLNDYLNSISIQDHGDIEIKVHPFIFERLKLKKVPALVVAECPAAEFRSRECEFKYMVKGEVPFEGFLNILNEEETEYSNLYFDFVNQDDI